MDQRKETCAYPGCTETKGLYDLTPFNWPDGTGTVSACKEHYDAVAHELLEDGCILDSDWDMTQEE